MFVEKELKNRHEPNAIVIKMTLLSNIPCEFHDKVTREAKGKSPEQRVKNIPDKVVGRVPASLCKLFRCVLTKIEVSKITCIASESPILNKIPRPQQSFFCNKGEHDRQGGGFGYTMGVPVVVLGF